MSETGSRRVLTSQPGKRGKGRVGSGSSKGRKARKSGGDLQAENPYNSENMEQTQQQFYRPEDGNMINITTQENLNKTGEVQPTENLTTDQQIMNLNNSQEQPLAKISEKPGTAKTMKRRIFSSANPRRGKTNNKFRHRAATAKYGARRPTHQNNFRSGSQVYNYMGNTKKPKTSTGSYKNSTKRRKKIPLNDYNWPENTNVDNHNNRPTTAKQGSYGAQNGRPDFDSMRQNIQSRGKAAPTGLSGTSVSRKYGILLTNTIGSSNFNNEMGSYQNDQLSKTQPTFGQNMNDMILADSGPPEGSTNELGPTEPPIENISEKPEPVEDPKNESSEVPQESAQETIKESIQETNPSAEPASKLASSDPAAQNSLNEPESSK